MQNSYHIKAMSKMTETSASGKRAQQALSSCLMFLV